MTNFQQAIQFVLKHEGGYVCNPNDPGGETNYGISKQEYPDLDIKNLTVANAMDIYQRDYWDAYSLDPRAFPYSIALLDSYVQHSPTHVQTWDQQCGDDYKALIQLRRVYYLTLIQKNPKERVFKNGWMNRLNDLGKYCDILSNSG